MKEQLIKRYASWGTYGGATRKFKKDAAKLAREGWMVQSQSATRSHGILTTKSSQVTVVYERTLP